MSDIEKIKITKKQAEEMLRATGGTLAITDIPWIINNWIELGYIHKKNFKSCFSCKKYTTCYFIQSCHKFNETFLGTWFSDLLRVDYKGIAKRCKYYEVDGKK